MANTETLEPKQQLRAAVDDEVRRAPREEGEVLVVSAPTLMPTSCKSDDYSYPAEVVSVPVELVGRLLRDDNGTPFLGWVFEGSLHVFEDELRRAGGMDGLPTWLRTRLGPACVSVRVHSRQGDSVHVTAAFLINTGAAL